MHGTTEQAWKAAKAKLNAQFNKRRRNVVLECLQFGGNKEFWNGFPNEYEIEDYFKKCYYFAVDKIGYLGTDENIICAVIITEPNRRNLFVYYLPVTPKWKVKIMSKEKNDYGTLLQLIDENSEPLYRKKENFDSPLLCRTEFWKQRGGITSFSDLQEDFFKKFPKSTVQCAKALRLLEALVSNRESVSEDTKMMNTTLFPILTTHPTAIKIFIFGK